MTYNVYFDFRPNSNPAALRESERKKERKVFQVCLPDSKLGKYNFLISVRFADSTVCFLPLYLRLVNNVLVSYSKSGPVFFENDKVPA